MSSGGVNGGGEWDGGQVDALSSGMDLMGIGGWEAEGGGYGDHHGQG